jgi:hypothetical protein
LGTLLVYVLKHEKGCEPPPSARVSDIFPA